MTQRTSLYAEERHKSAMLAAVLSFFLPGLGQIYAGRVLRGLVLGIPQTVALIAFVWIYLRQGAIMTGVSLAIQGDLVAMILVLLLLFRTFTVVDAYWIAAQRDGGLSGSRQRVVASVVALALLLTVNAGVLGYGAYNSYLADNAADDITGSCNNLDPNVPRPRNCPRPSTQPTAPPTGVPTPPGQTPAPTPTLGPGQTATPSPTAAPTAPTGTPYWAENGRLDVLLLGADKAPGGTRNAGLRTDTMIVASIDVATGRAALFGIPRNVLNAPLPDTMTSTWSCHCVQEYLFGVGTYVGDGRLGFVDGDDNKYRAVTEVIQNIIQVELDGMVLVDLGGFVKVVDALGGIDINVREAVYDEKYGNEEGRRELVDIKEGLQHFDGHTALMYVRSRHQDSDYGRMGRQQDFLRAARAEFTACNLLPRLPGLISAVGDSVRTDIPIEEVPALVELMSRSKQPRRFEFTPEKGYGIDWSEGGRTLDRVRDAVQQGFAPRGGGDDPAEPDESLPPPPANPC